MAANCCFVGYSVIRKLRLERCLPEHFLRRIAPEFPSDYAQLASITAFLARLERSLLHR
jgi:hypothetical protein